VNNVSFGRYLEGQLETGTLKLIEEKKAIAEISNLKKSRKIFESFDARQAEIDQDREAIEEIRKQLDANQPDKTLNSSWDDIKSELDIIEKNKSNEIAKVKSLHEERINLQKEIDDLYQARKQKIEVFRQNKEEYFASIQEERKRKQEEFKRRKEQEEIEKLQAAAERERELAEIPAFVEEIQVCTNLIHFLSQYSSNKTSVQATPSKVAARNVRAVENAIPEGAKVLVRKTDREEEDLFFSGKNNKKGKKNKPSNEQTKQPGVLKLPLSIMEEFWRIKVEVPVSTADADKTIEAIKEKKSWFEENQKKATAENQAKAEKKIQALLSSKATKTELADTVNESNDSLAGEESVTVEDME